MSVEMTARYYKPENEPPIVAVKIVAAPSTTISSYHIALLIDCSGSMEGEGMPAVISTLHTLVNTMTNGNRITIIGYSHIYKMIANAVLLTDASRPVLNNDIDKLVPDGSTNLECAIEALSAVGPAIDSLFIMTDGHINTGITNPTGLQRHLTARLPKGCAVNTLGFGAEHNAAMLSRMAIAGRGSYTYADSKEMIPAIIGDIIGGLSAQVYKNANLAGPNTLKCLEIGIDSTKPNTYFIGTIIAEKPQWVLFETDESSNPCDGEDPPAIWCKDTVRTDVLSLQFTSGNNSYTQMVPITRMPPEEKIEIVEQIERIRVAKGFAQATEYLERNRIDDALRLLTDLNETLGRSIAKDTIFVLRLQASVDEMKKVVHAHRQAPYTSLDRLVTRMISNTTTLATQTGFISNLDSTTNDPENTQIFSTPLQVRTTSTMSPSLDQRSAEGGR